MAYILALDQGTTSSRAILFDRAGQVVAVAQQEFRQVFPQSGWVEHDATAIWRTQLAMAQAVLGKASIGVAEVEAIGITN
jgi:glycerol kinase